MKKQIIIKNVEGSCHRCYESKIKRISEKKINFQNAKITYNVEEKEIYIAYDASNLQSPKSTLKDLGYQERDIYELSLVSDIDTKELDVAFKKPRKVKKDNFFVGLIKPSIGLLIGYTELCCILMSLLPVNMLFMVAALNLGLIVWLGWDYFKTAKSSLMYLMPAILVMLVIVTLPFIMPVAVSSWSFLWSVCLAFSVSTVVWTAWYIRQSLSMETLITLSISMAWLFSTLQLLIPVLSVAFGAQIYFHDSMIILGVVGIATQIKNSWSIQRNHWLVYENRQFVYKNSAAIAEEQIIVLSANTAYPFPLRILSEAQVEIDSSIRNDKNIKELRTAKQGDWILPWEDVQQISTNRPIYAKVGHFRKSRSVNTPGWADKIAQYFLPAMLTIACLAASLWYVFSPQTVAISYAIKAFMGVLMAACPCVLAVVAPICEAIGKEKVSQDTHTHLKDQVSVRHLSTINKVVFDKTGTLTEKTPVFSDNWPMRSGCEKTLTSKLQQQGKNIFILSGDDSATRYQHIIEHMALDTENVICHPVFSSSYKGEHSGAHYKSILLSWLALPDHTGYPENIIRLVEEYHNIKDDSQKKSNEKKMIDTLMVLEKNIKPLQNTHLLYIDDGPGLEKTIPGCLTLQCTGTNKGLTPSLVADGQIENPASLPKVFEIMWHTQNYLNEQLQLAMLYNVIAIPLMAGAFSFWLMPAPWIGALLMNVFSIYLIYRSKKLVDYLNEVTLPKVDSASFNPENSENIMNFLSSKKEIENQNGTRIDSLLMPRNTHA